MGPRLQLLDVRIQMEHPQHQVQAVGKLAEAGAMVPGIDQVISRIVPILVCFVVGDLGNTRVYIGGRVRRRLQILQVKGI